MMPAAEVDVKLSSLPVIALSLGLVGCGGGDGGGITELELEVVVTDGNVVLHAYEPERSFECNQRVWLEPGGCDMTTDAFVCETEPHAHCIEALAVEENGAVIGEGVYDADFQDGFVAVDSAPTRDLELVVTGCGGEARIPITATALPTPAIIDVSTVGSDMVVQWSSDDSTATGVVGWSGGFGGPRCHVERGQTTSLMAPTGDPQFLTVYLEAYTAPIEHGTGLGLARVRARGVAAEEQ
jgi:hypothetical protein